MPLPSGRQAAGLPGPRGLPVVGILSQLRSDPLRLFLDAADRFGDVVHVKAGRYQGFLLSAPGDIKHVLQDNARNYHRVRSTSDSKRPSERASSPAKRASGGVSAASPAGVPPPARGRYGRRHGQRDRADAGRLARRRRAGRSHRSGCGDDGPDAAHHCPDHVQRGSGAHGRCREENVADRQRTYRGDALGDQAGTLAADPREPPLQSGRP